MSEVFSIGSFWFDIMADKKFKFDRNYVRQINWLLYSIIEKSNTGKIVFSHMRKTGKKITIRPLENDVKNSFTSNSLKEVKYATAKGRPIYNENGNFVQDGICFRGFGSCGISKGVGGGATPTIKFSPQTFYPAGACADISPTGEAGSKPSEVLFHELMHAYRKMRGTQFHQVLSGNLSQYENLEEFFAIVVTNIYISDPSSTISPRLLRAGHDKFGPLPDNLATTEGFLSVKENAELIESLSSDEPDLVADLANIEAPFNPFKKKNRIAIGASTTTAATHKNGHRA